VEAVEVIGRKCKISDKDLETVVVAAWFHDTGYYLGCMNHEEASTEIARDFLVKHGKSGDFIEDVTKCILSTKVPQKPNSLLEKIICDADLYHLATEKFFEKSELLWKEFSHTDETMTPESWLNQSKEFAEAHQYHTKFGKEKLLPKLKKNVQLLITKIDSNS
jgi:predicted metal-dependent HD superfamily phosphohydrolase